MNTGLEEGLLVTRQPFVHEQPGAGGNTCVACTVMTACSSVPVEVPPADRKIPPMRSLYPTLLAGLVAVLTACGTATTSAPQLPATSVSPAVTAAPQPTQSPAADTGVLVSLHQSGGIANVDNTLTVYSDGRIELTNKSGQVQVSQASAGDLEHLRELLNSSELAQAAPHARAPGADQMTYELTLTIDGKPRTITTMDGAKNAKAVDQVLAELAKLRPARTASSLKG